MSADRKERQRLHREAREVNQRADFVALQMSAVDDDHRTRRGDGLRSYEAFIELRRRSAATAEF